MVLLQLSSVKNDNGSISVSIYSKTTKIGRIVDQHLLMLDIS